MIKKDNYVAKLTDEELKKLCETIDIDTDSIKKNKRALYPPSFYKQYGGKAPQLPALDEALEDDLIPWYNPAGQNYD